MALIKWRPRHEWDPFGDMMDLQKEINRLFNLSLTRGKTPLEAGWVPAVDIYKEGDTYHLEADLPGISKDDLTLSVQDNVVSLKGTRKSKKERTDENYYCYERSSGEFYRTFELPDEINAGQVKAAFKDGILKAELPVAESAKPKQVQIDIT